MSDADERHERPGGRWLPVAVLRPFAPAHLPDVECISRMAELMRQVRVERRGRWPITSARNSTPGPPCRLVLRHRRRARRLHRRRRPRQIEARLRLLKHSRADCTLDDSVATSAWAQNAVLSVCPRAKK